MKSKKRTQSKKCLLISSPLRILQMHTGIPIVLMLALLFFSCHQNPNQKAPQEQQKVLSERVESQNEEQTAVEGPKVVNGKDVETGLLAAEGLQIVKASCTGCHSSKLIIQNRLSREVWHEKIVWMQETQGLWDLGENEDIILDYLAKNYGPGLVGGRRAPLENIKWYKLED